MTLVPTIVTLDSLQTGQGGTVIHLTPGSQANAGVDVARRLMELGFVPGEQVRVLKRSMPGGDPIAVRVGHSTFALRRFEAALIAIKPE